VIAFVGSVFSPAYARARRARAGVDPLAHCGFNVVVHGPGDSSWAFAEYRGDDVERDADRLRLGRNTIVRHEHGVTIAIDERTSPWGRPLRGQVSLRIDHWHDRRFALDAAGAHQWWPLAPRARAHVALEEPAFAFDGHGYHDSNGGREPLERSLATWHWSRTSDRDATSVLYDVTPREGALRRISLRFDGAGGVCDDDAPTEMRSLGRSRWGIERVTRLPAGADAEVLESLLDAPFYARSLLAVRDHDRSALAVHEVVDLDRFVRPSTQLMLPFRIRGVGWW
jgi:carotenoid 1,2-hydratase